MQLLDDNARLESAFAVRWTATVGNSMEINANANTTIKTKHNPTALFFAASRRSKARVSHTIRVCVRLANRPACRRPLPNDQISKALDFFTRQSKELRDKDENRVSALQSH